MNLILIFSISILICRLENIKCPDTPCSSHQEEGSSSSETVSLSEDEEVFAPSKWTVRCRVFEEHPEDILIAFVEHNINGKNPWLDLANEVESSETENRWSRLCQLLWNEPPEEGHYKVCPHSKEHIILASREKRIYFTVRLTKLDMTQEKQKLVKPDFLRCYCYDDDGTTVTTTKFFLSRYSDTEYFKLTNDQEEKQSHLKIDEYCILKLKPSD